MRKLSGWQKAGVVVGIGCSSIVALVLVGAAVAFVWARTTLARYGDPATSRVDRTVTVADAAGATAGSLTIDFQEADVTISPGPPGTQVGVEGTYAEGLYDLSDSRTDDEGRQRTTIRFRPKAPALARLIGGVGRAGARPAITVTIPAGTPFDLALRLGMGNSQIDLGGLMLSALSLDLSMGNHTVDFTQPVAAGPRRVRLNASMGSVSIVNLGNARTQAVDASASMGSLAADLGGAWPTGSAADMAFTHSMGELTLRVPESVRLETDGGAAPAAPAGGAAGATAPVVRLRVTSSMGESRVVRY